MRISVIWEWFRIELLVFSERNQLRWFAHLIGTPKWLLGEAFVLCQTGRKWWRDYVYPDSVCRVGGQGTLGLECRLCDSEVAENEWIEGSGNVFFSDKMTDI